VEAFGKNAARVGFADAQRAFNDDEAGRLGSAAADASAFAAEESLPGIVSCGPW